MDTKRKARKEDIIWDRSIHNVFSWLFFAMQIFGFAPLQGIFKRDLSAIRLACMSWIGIYALLTGAGMAFMLATQVARIFIYNMHTQEMQRFFYFMKSLFSSWFFFAIARDWKHILIRWNEVDKALVQFGKPKCVKRKLNIMVVFFIVAFIGDYVLIQTQRTEKDFLKLKFKLSWKAWEHFQKYKIFNYIYELYPYNFFSSVCLLIIQLQVLFSGTFVDLFIIGTSFCLASRMKLITSKIKEMSFNRSKSDEVWINLRESYNKLELLCSYINSKIGVAILMSFIGNLGILLIHLYHGTKVHGVIERSYLYYSFVFLLSRTIAVCIFGAKINDESQKPLSYLFTIDNYAYNVEIKRLTHQIGKNTLVLSGMNFFHLRRNILLKIAGSIVTYELVLVQFAEDILKETHSANRTTAL